MTGPLPHPRPLAICSVALVLVAQVGCAGEEGDPGPARVLDEPAGGGAGDGPWLREATGEWGLDFVHDAGPTEGRHLPQIVGSGAALFDYDGDGFLDLYLIQAGDDPALGKERGGSSNRLYANEEGRRFSEVAGAAGLVGAAYGLGVTVGDVHNDGHDDVYLANYGLDQLYRNVSGERFEDVTGAAGIEVDGFSTASAFLDYDRDGDLDLYVVKYADYDPERRCYDPAERHDYCGPTTFPADSDRLFENRGDGTFADRSVEAGIAGPAAAGLGVVVRDFNEDGWIDAYVANDTYENYLWVNQKDGTFADEAVMLGVAYNMHGQHEAGMGVIAEDLDDDGLVDLFMTHLNRETNTLYRNLGTGLGFMDVTGQTALGSSSMIYTGFGTVAFDLELDGDLDIAVANGRVTRGDFAPPFDVPPHWQDYAEPNLLYRNEGGLTFSPGADLAPAFCELREVSRAIAAGDIDNDGDVDLVLTNIDGPARLFLNEAPRQGHWLELLLVDPALSRCAIGAQVTLSIGDFRRVRTVGPSYGYLASNDPRVHFAVPADRVRDGLGEARLTVRWPDGLVEELPVPGLDRVETIRRGDGRKVE